jgi:diamine N-acetyltransferase
MGLRDSLKNVMNNTVPEVDPVAREWIEEDVDAVRRITWQTWIATYASFIPARDLRSYFNQHYSLEALRQLWEDKHFRGYIAVVESVPAGYAKTNYSVSENKLYVQSMYVLPEHQGRGIGRLLLRCAEKRAREFDLDRIWLGVMVQNANALAWYRKIGFEFVEETPFMIGETTVQHLIGYRLLQNVTPESRE